ncbi:MAG: hypothetical protein WCC48_08870 [Anaeromyxobacteraceae bacterium]
MTAKLGEILIRRGACSPEAVAEALRNQVIFGGRLGTNLLELGAVREGDLARALGERHGLPTLHGELKLDAAAVALLKPALADRYGVVPYLLQDRKLALLVGDPNDLPMLDEVAFVTGRHVHPIVVPEARLWALLRGTYGLDRQLRGLERPAPAPTPLPDRPYDIVAEVTAILRAGPGHVAPDHFVPLTVPPPAAAPAPTPLSFQEALSRLAGVDDRHAIAGTVLRYARTKFKRTVLLTVQRGEARGWAGLGEQVDPQAVSRMRLKLDAPGVVSMVVGARAHFLGPLPRTDANVRLLKLLGGGVPSSCFLVPILALGRVVNVIYADNGRGGRVDSGDLGELLILATKIAQSYDALLARATQS